MCLQWNIWPIYSRIQGFSLSTLVFFCGSSPKTQFLVIYWLSLAAGWPHLRWWGAVEEPTTEVCVSTFTHTGLFNSSFEHWHTLRRCCSWGLFNLDELVRKHSKDNPYQNADVNMARAFTEEELEIKCTLFTWTQCDHSWVEQCCETERERLFYISTVNVLLSVKTCVVKGSETVPWVSEVKSSSHVKAPQIRWLGRLFFLLFWSRVSNEGRGIAGSSVFFS